MNILVVLVVVNVRNPDCIRKLHVRPCHSHPDFNLDQSHVIELTIYLPELDSRINFMHLVYRLSKLE